MGSLIGHVSPGTLLVVLSLRWCYAIFTRFLISNKHASSAGNAAKYKKHEFRSSLFYPCICCKRLPVEQFLIVVLAIVAMIGDCISAFTNGKLVRIGNGQHMALYFFWSLTGAVDIARHYRWNIPPSLEYSTGLLAVLVEVVLLLHHLHSRSPMDTQLHMLLVYVMSASFFLLAIEMKNRGKPMAALARVFSTALQGTWLIQVGLMLYPVRGMKIWDQESHDQMMVVTMMFACHIAMLFIVFSIIGGYASYRVRAMSGIDAYHLIENLPLDTYRIGSDRANANMRLSSSTHNEEVLQIISGSEEEI